MSPEMKARITHYEEGWARLNAVNALIADLMAERENIKAEQRSLANGLVSRVREQMEEQP